jgi:hypothetical protein
MHFAAWVTSYSFYNLGQLFFLTNPNTIKENPIANRLDESGSVIVLIFAE